MSAAESQAESWHAALHRLQREGRPHVLATQVTSAGSTPREPGARMVITENAVYDTLGGGTFEWQTIEAARGRLAGVDGRVEAGMSLEAFSLGGRSGQCCGGFVNVLLEVFPGSAATLAIFGAGHVGQALVRLAAPLPWRLLWHDSRDVAFPEWAAEMPRLECRPATDPAAAVAALPPGAHALVMTHDHAEDRSLMDALLARGDTGSLGLIGSRSKWASFRSQLGESGHDEAALARVRCPIGTAAGGTGGDKTPYAIALAAVAELLPLVESPERGDQRGLDPAELRSMFTDEPHKQAKTRGAWERPKRRSCAMGEEDSSERAGHGWPAPALQAKQDARAQQGVGSVQGGIHSASSQAYPRLSPSVTNNDEP